MINEANMSNDIQQPTSELNGRTIDDFDDSWLHCNVSFETIPLEDKSTPYKTSGIKATFYALY